MSITSDYFYCFLYCIMDMDLEKIYLCIFFPSSSFLLLLMTLSQSPRGRHTVLETYSRRLLTKIVYPPPSSQRVSDLELDYYCLMIDNFILWYFIFCFSFFLYSFFGFPKILKDLCILYFFSHMLHIQ